MKVLGDAGQLPPVLDRPLPEPTANGDMSKLGEVGCSTFDEKVFILVQWIRQTGDVLCWEVFPTLGQSARREGLRSLH